MKLKNREENNSYIKVICDNIRKAREDIGMKQSFVAKLIGYSTVYYNKIECGLVRTIDVSLLIQLRDVLRIKTGNINWFLVKHFDKKEIENKNRRTKEDFNNEFTN